MTNVTSTHISCMRETAARVKASVCELLQWDEMDYAQYQYSNGITYLHWLLLGDNEARDYLERSKLFWNWWKNQWVIHDIVFLDSDVETMELEEVQKFYHRFHCAKTTAYEVKPRKEILQGMKKKAF